MQKRIKLDQVLRQKNINYPSLWGKLIEMINESSPIFYLDSFGAIAFIDNSLYLLIDSKVMTNYCQVQPMVDLQQYFLRPECYRLNFHYLSKMERYVMEFFASYVKEIINTNHYIYLTVLDMHRLGKLVVSKNNIEYFNGLHHWKYQMRRNVVQLPTLLAATVKHQASQEKMARKLSLSVKNFTNNSLKKQQGKKEVKLDRPQSASKLNGTFNKNLSTHQQILLHNNRVATQNYQRRVKSKTKSEVDKLKIYEKSSIPIKTETNIIKTQPSNVKEDVEARPLRRKSTSRQKLSLSRTKKMGQTSQSNEKKVNVQLQSSKKKLTLQQPKQSRVPSVRQRLTEQGQQQSQYQIMIRQFVGRSTSKVIQQPQLQDVEQSKIKEYLLELTSIYMQKEGKVRQNREKKARLIAQQAKALKIIKRTQHVNMKQLEQSLCLSETDYKIFNQCYDLVHKYTNLFTKETSAYIVSYKKHSNIIQALIGKFNIKISISKLTKRTMILVSLLLHQFLHFVKETEISLLNRIITHSKKIISINILKQSSFREDIMDFVHKFQAIFAPLIDCLKLNFSKPLWIQQYEVESIKSAKSTLHSFLVQHTSAIQDNFMKFRTASCKSILNTTYHTQKEGLALIKKLDQLKYSLENELQFKSQLYFPGVCYNLNEVNEQYLILISQKYYDIYTYFYKVYEKSESELNNKLKTIIVINVDYLSDYKCREYRDEIEEHYKNLLESLMLIIDHFYYLFKESQFNAFLGVAYDFKSQINHNLLNFSNKLQEYRNNSNKTIKMLEIKSKENKEIYQVLTQKLKKLLATLNSQRAILQFKQEIMQLDQQFVVYSENNSKLVQSMKENEMVYWQDDQFFINNITLLKSSLQFLQGKNYKVFFSISIGELTINQFYAAYEEFNNFMGKLSDTKIEKLFKPTFTLIQTNLVLVQIVLYKEYTQFQLQKSKEIGIDISSQKNSKIFATIKRYQNLQKRKFEQMIELYRQSRLNQFNLYHDESLSTLKVEKVRGTYELEFINNMTELKLFLYENNNIKASFLLNTLNKLEQLYKEILIFNKMIYLISQSTLSDTLKDTLLHNYNKEYESLLSLSSTDFEIQKFRNKLQEDKLKYMQIYYHQRVNAFTRYALCSIQELIDLNEWQNNSQITRNIKYIFNCVDDVTFDTQGNILSFEIAKDCLAFDKPFNIFEKEGEIAKIIYLHTENFLRNSVNRSEFACIYIKLLIWHIYFTQQVELCFMTQSSLERVKDNFLQLIKEIANQIRYDIKLHYKSYEIAQLNFFISHIDKIKNTHLITDFEWVSTIRYYEKLKIVKIEQNDRVHDYSFEIKRPLNYDPSFQLETNISYGFKESSLYYEISAYILGKPFVTFHTLSDYGFQANYSVLMNFIKKYEYFVCIVASPENFKSINYFHKKILQLSLKKLGSIEQETLNMPVYFQYPCEAALPLCFPEKYRNFSNPEFSYDLNLIILLELNKYQEVFDRAKINIQVLVTVLNFINIKKSLTLKKATSFVESLSAFLLENPEKLDIQTFCYKYFIVNYQLDDHTVAGMLDELIQENQDSIISLMKEKQAVINDFLRKDKQELIIYGPTSFKSKLIKEMKIPLYYEQSKSNVCHIQGLQEYLSFKKGSPQMEKKVIIQDRFIHHIDPAMLCDAVLHYSGELTLSNVQLIFKSRIIEMQLDGNSELLWLKFHSFYKIFAEISGEHVSLLGMAELILRCYQSHIIDFLDELEKEEKEFYKLNINKETIRAFLVIAHEIFYYLLSLEQRKKFTEKLKALPFMEEFRSEELHSMTCKGLSCDKLLNLAKKQKVTFRNIGNYSKQFIIIKKYLRYEQPIALYCTSKITAKLLKQQIQSLDYSKIDITLNQRYIDILRISKYSNILYIVNDLHLEDKQSLTFLKVRQELRSARLSYYLMFTQNHSYRRAMKSCVGFKFSDIEMEEIYRFQNKEGIADTVQIKCKNIWNDGYFANEPTFLMFLINVSVKLPSQYFKKFFARQMILTKFCPAFLAIDTIGQNDEMIRRVADVTSTNAYLIEYRGHHQEVTETQINKRIEKLMSSLTFVERIIVKDYYKEIIPYALADKVYIIKEDIPVLPLIITHIHERKYFKIQNSNFLAELIEVIEEVYNNEKECTLIIQEPLSSSQQWSQFMSNYLKGIDLINLYSELREYTELLASKQQYVYRLQDQAIPLKDKVSQIIYDKIKIIVSQTVLSNLSIDSDELYINNIVYLNCSLTISHKQGITQSIIKKMLQQSNKEVSSVFSSFQPFILQLIRSDLLFISRMEQFLKDIIATIKQELQQISRFKEVMTIKRKLFRNLASISEVIKRQFQQIGVKDKENKMFLASILEEVNSCENEEEQYVEMYNYQQLIKLRDEFTCSQQRNIIWLKGNLQYERIYQMLQEMFFQNCLKSQYGAAILALTSDVFTKILNNSQQRKQLEELCLEESTKQDCKSFILLRYVKFILDLSQIYQHIDYSASLIQYQVRKINYYYLLDICVQLKAKEQTILREFDDLSHRKRLIDDFTSILREVQHIDIEEQQLFHYHIFNRIKKIIRSYAIEAHQYPLMKILNKYDSQFLKISNMFEQYLLKQSQTSFDNCNKSILTQKKNMIVYDPHSKIQSLCHELSIKIIYVNSEQDIEQLYDYKFKMTVFCIKLETMQDFYLNRKMIGNCLAIISKKHTDLKENILEKLVISIDQREILSEIKQEFSVINLGYSFVKFTQELERSIFDQKYSWSCEKEEYLDSKRRLRVEIELIKTLNPEEISLYIIKLQALIRNFQQHHQSIRQISSIVLFNQADMLVLESLFKMMINLHHKIEFPMNLSLRLLRNINIQEMIAKWEATSSLSQKEQEEWLKNILLHNRSENISEQIEACITQSRYIAIIYEQFNKKSIMEVIQLQQSKKYIVRTIIEINHEELKEFICSSSLVPDNREVKEIVLFFVKFHQISKLSKIINKCSVLWI